MPMRLIAFLSILAMASARAAVIPYEAIRGTEITFEDAVWLGAELETRYSGVGAHFFEAGAIPVYSGSGTPSNVVLINNQPLPCLVAGLCPPYAQILPPVSSPLAPDHRWRPMWVTFDAPIAEFGFQEVPAFSYSSRVVDSIRAYRAGVFVGEESFDLPPGFGMTGVAVQFDTPFDLVLLDRQVVDPVSGASVFIDGPEFIDDVRFAPAIVGSIPEPGAFLLFACGAVVTVLVRGARRTR